MNVPSSAGRRAMAALAAVVVLAVGACSGNAKPETSGPDGDHTSGERQAFRLEASGTDATSRLPRPRILLARTFREAGEAADRAVVPGPATGLSSWDDFAERALVAVLAGPQPDAGYVVRVTSVVLLRGGRLLRIGGRVTRTPGAAAAAVSVPWALLSIEADAATRVRRCVLTLEGRPPFRSACR